MLLCGSWCYSGRLQGYPQHYSRRQRNQQVLARNAQRLENRGVKDVLFFCVDGLPGFKEAIQAVYPQAEIQRCVIHMLRNSFKYVNYNDLKKFSSDFKAVYNAPNETAALSELENIKEKWGKKYPYAISNWENNWEDVSSFSSFLMISGVLCTRQIS
mgnify:CR=1 FL=1